MTIIPLGFGGLMIYSFFLPIVIIGAIVVLICIGLLTSQGRVTIDFELKKYRSYILVFGLKFGKWKKLFSFEKITLTNRNEQYKETNWSPFQNRTTNRTMYTFRSNSTNLNIRNNSDKLTIAIGDYEKMKDLGLEVSQFTRMDLYDFTEGKMELVK
jgi:hypothetical protein